MILSIRERRFEWKCRKHPTLIDRADRRLDAEELRDLMCYVRRRRIVTLAYTCVELKVPR